jgi:hypothetical protein
VIDPSQRPLPDNTQVTRHRHLCPRRDSNRQSRKQAATDPRFTPCGHWDQPQTHALHRAATGIGHRPTLHWDQPITASSPLHWRACALSKSSLWTVCLQSYDEGRNRKNSTEIHTAKIMTVATTVTRWIQTTVGHYLAIRKLSRVSHVFPSPPASVHWWSFSSIQ